MYYLIVYPGSNMEYLISIYTEILKKYSIDYSICEYDICCQRSPCKKGSFYQILKNANLEHDIKEENKYCVFYRSDHLEWIEKDFIPKLKSELGENAISSSSILNWIKENKIYNTNFTNKWLLTNSNIYLFDYKKYEENNIKLFMGFLQKIYPYFTFIENDIKSIINKTIIPNVDYQSFLLSIQDPVIQDPVIQDPVIQDQVVQDPVIQEPVVQEPVVQEPVIQDQVVQDPVIQDQVIQDPVIQDPVIQDPVIQELDIENNIIQNENIDIQNTVIENAVIENTVIEDTDIENTVIENTVIEDADIEDADIENTNIEENDIEESDIEESEIESDKEEFKIESCAFESVNIKIGDENKNGEKGIKKTIKMKNKNKKQEKKISAKDRTNMLSDQKKKILLRNHINNVQTEIYRMRHQKNKAGVLMNTLLINKLKTSLRQINKKKNKKNNNKN